MHDSTIRRRLAPTLAQLALSAAELPRIEGRRAILSRYWAVNADLLWRLAEQGPDVGRGIIEHATRTKPTVPAPSA